MPSLPPPPRPNLVVIVSDDTSPAYFGHAGGPYLTPTLDSLARDGVRFTDAQVVSPVSTPSRWSYLTGQYPSRCTGPGFLAANPPGGQANIRWDTDLPPGQPSLATLLRDAGYATGYVGKYHAGRRATDLGLEEIPLDHDPRDPRWAAVRQRNHDRAGAELRACGWEYADHVTWGNLDQNAFLNLEIHHQEWITEAALAFLDARPADPRPFCLVMGTHVVHGPKHGENLPDLDPLVTPAGVLPAPLAGNGGHPPRASLPARLRAAGLEPDHRNVGMLWLDDAVAAVLHRLHRIGAARDTIVVYHADHGVAGKGTCYLDGARVPLLWRWPGRLPAGEVRHAAVQNTDFLPTVADLLGLDPAAAGLRPDGRSYAAHLLAGRTAPLHDQLYHEMGIARCLQHGRFRYHAVFPPAGTIARLRSGALPVAPGHLLQPGGGMAVYHHRHYFEPEQLYDVAQDTAEQIDLARHERYAPVLADLRARLRGVLDTLGRAYPAAPDPFLATDAYRRLVAAAQAAADRVDIGYFHDRYW